MAYLKSLRFKEPMATGLNIRDFTKVYRELRYANEGSIRLSEIEHNAYLNRLTLEITHYDAYRSISFKTNPENTHWGYLTSFKGSSVIGNSPIKFVKQRVYEHINQGIYSYHQATEAVRLEKSFAESVASSILQSDLLEEVQQTVVDFYLSLIGNLPGQIEEDLQWILSFTYRSDNAPEPSNQAYTAFPLASPFPDVFKFKSDVPVSFLFRLESWYLVNPAVYIVANPSDTSDATEGEDEYPDPEAGDGSGGSEEFPDSSPVDPQNDPRDGGTVPRPDPDASTVYNWLGVVSGTADFGPGLTPGPLSENISFQLTGSGSPFTVVNGPTESAEIGGVKFFNGFDVKNRFGQVVASSRGAGYASGSLSGVFTLQS